MYVHCTCVMIATFLSTVRAALVAQMVERKTLNLVVVGSSPTEGAFFFEVFLLGATLEKRTPEET